MKIKPTLFDSIQTKHTSFDVDLKLDSNVTFINGDSGTGKSAVFSFLQEMAAENASIRCFNYLDQKKGYKSSIKRFKDKLIVIDNADILLDDALRSHIALDDKNQYIIIGRNPTGLMLALEDVRELVSTVEAGRTLFTLKKGI